MSCWSKVPSYIGAIAAFRNLQAELVGVRLAPDGMEIEDLIARIEACQRARSRSSSMSFLTFRILLV
jgi:DNA-binding transcriptional MocR family regulator